MSAWPHAAVRRHASSGMALRRPHARQLLLEQATIDADGWARWDEGGQVMIGYLQAGRRCDPSEVSALS
jgi:hypothetical protein